MSGEVRLVDPAEGRCEIDAPSLEGIECEVQHAVGKGDFTKERGRVGVGVIVLPTGQPKIVLQVHHADGTSLGVLLGGPETWTLRQIFADCDEKATAISKAADQAVRQ